MFIFIGNKLITNEYLKTEIEQNPFFF
jgi:hypothetical protein